MHKKWLLLGLAALMSSACNFNLFVNNSTATPTSSAVVADPTATPDPLQEVATHVEEFGTHLQLVSVLAPDAAAQIEAEYAAFVSPELLEAWMADPASAPGRVTSSPWPDRIEVTEVTQEDFDSFHVEAELVEATNDDSEVARYALLIQVERIDDAYVIIAFTQLES